MWIENRLLTSKTDHLRRLLTLYNEYPVPLEVDTGSLRLLAGRFFHSIQWLASSRVGGKSLREFPFRCVLFLARHGERTSSSNFRSRWSTPGSSRRGSPLAKSREGRSRRGGCAGTLYGPCRLRISISALWRRLRPRSRSHARDLPQSLGPVRRQSRFRQLTAELEISPGGVYTSSGRHAGV